MTQKTKAVLPTDDQQANYRSDQEYVNACVARASRFCTDIKKAKKNGMDIKEQRKLAISFTQQEANMTFNNCMERESNDDEWQGKVDEADPCGPLYAKAAEEVWKILYDAGLVDERHLPRMKKMRAVVLAAVISIKLNLSPRWTPFEYLWHIKDMSTKWCRVQTYDYFPEFYKYLMELLCV